MYTNELQYAVEAVENINDEIMEAMETANINIMTNDYFLKINSDSYNVAITFMGERIWLSTDDEREYIDNDIEPLETFLKRNCMKIINDLQKLFNVMCNR